MNLRVFITLVHLGYDESTTVPEEVQIFPAAVGPLGYGTGNTRLLNINFCALEDIHLIQ